MADQLVELRGVPKLGVSLYLAARVWVAGQASFGDHDDLGPTERVTERQGTSGSHSRDGRSVV
jgi:hypothetical protein